MPSPWTLILHSGGLRSLVATALAVGESDKPRVALLHLLELRPSAATRLDHVRQQADRFAIKRLIELEMPRIAPAVVVGAARPGPKDPPPLTPLHRALVLSTALAQALELGADRVIWPVQFDGDVKHTAHATELSIIATHLAEAELGTSTRTPPRLELPLVELTDRQVIELGGQLGVPWELAWTCQLATDQPCHTCDACRRRQHAFEAAGIVDPIDPAAIAR